MSPNLLPFSGAPLGTDARLPLASHTLSLQVRGNAVFSLEFGVGPLPLPSLSLYPPSTCITGADFSGSAPCKSAPPFSAKLLRTGISPSVHNSEALFLVAVSYPPIISLSNSNKNESQVKFCLIHTFLNTNLLANRPN